MITGVFGPMLFGIDANLPFLLFGGIVALWALIIWYALNKQARTISKGLGGENANKRGPFSAFAPAAATPWSTLESRYYVANKEYLDQKLSGGKKNEVDIAYLEQSVRKLNAALKAEAYKRKKIEEKLEDLMLKLN